VCGALSKAFFEIVYHKSMAQEKLFLLIKGTGKGKFQKVPGLRTFRTNGNVRFAEPVKRCFALWQAPAQLRQKEPDTQGPVFGAEGTFHRLV